ncbi:hypothetical protein ES703_117003 [subsurface metagenome]
MTTSIDIYSKVTDYIEHNINLKELESWLVSMLPTYLLNPNSGAAILAGSVELGLAEINAGITTERLLRNRLKKKFIRIPIKSQSYPYELGSEEAIGTASTTETTNLAWTNPSPSWSSVPQVANV